MHKQLQPQQINYLVSNGAVNNEFSKKVGELDRRLKANGMDYRQWDTLNDRQHDIFSDNLFLTGDCAGSVDDYVKGAVESCGCPDTEEELHHHSPVLMREIEKQQEMLPDMKVKIGERLENLNDFVDLVIEAVIVEAAEQTLEADINEIWLAYLLNGSKWNGIESFAGQGDLSPEQQVAMRERQLQEKFPRDADKRIASQKGRAIAMYDALSAAGWLDRKIARVGWTARPNSLGKFVFGTNKSGEANTPVNQDLNPSDIVIEFQGPKSKGPKPLSSFLGISAKSTKKKEGEIAWANRGVGTLFDPKLTKKEIQNKVVLSPKAKILQGKGGDKVYKAIKEEQDRLKAAAMVSAGKELAKLDPRKFDSVPALSSIAVKVNKKTDVAKISSEAVKTFIKRLEKTVNPIDDPNDEGYDASLDGVKPFSLYEMGPDLAAALVAPIKQEGLKSLSYARDQLLEMYQSLSPEDFKEHFLYFWVRMEGDALVPAWIKVTGRGTKGKYTATISQNSETVAKVASAPKFEFVPVGQTSVGIKYKEGKEEVKLAKIRMKFGSRSFTSIKPTGEAW